MAIVVHRRAHFSIYQTGTTGAGARLEGLEGAIGSLKELFVLDDRVLDSFRFQIDVVDSKIVVVRLHQEVVVRMVTVSLPSGDKLMIGILEDRSRLGEFIRAGFYEAHAVPREAQNTIRQLETLRNEDLKK